MISTDAAILKEHSEARRRMAEYGAFFDELHIIIPTRDHSAASVVVSEKVTAHPAIAWTGVGALWRADVIARQLFVSGGEWTITAQDPFENGLAAYRLSRRFGYPLQLQVHTDLFSPFFVAESWKNKIRLAIARRILPKADGVRVVSDRIRTSLIGRHLVDEKRITVLPIFTDRAATAAPNAKMFPGKHPVMLMASRLTREKNIGMAVEMMPVIIQKHPHAVLVIVGDGPERDNLKARIAHLKLDQHVLLEPQTNNLAAYYQSADIFLLTSNYEGYGRVAVEAAAANVPVIMTDVGVALGEVIPVGSVMALIEAVDRLISNPGVRQATLHRQREFLAALPECREEYLRDYAASLRFPRAKKLLMITQKVDLRDDVLGVYHQWIRGLAAHFDHISVICLYQGKTDLPENVSIYSLGKERGKSRIKYLWNFYRYVWGLRKNYDTVFVHMNPEYVILAGWLWRLWHKRLVLWYAHYLGTWKLRVAALFPEAIVTSVRQAYPFASRKLRVLQQGIDTDRFRPDDKRQADGSHFKILFLGRIAPVKHVDGLLQAFAAALPSIGNASLTIVGSPTAGKPVEADYYARIRSLAAESDARGRIELRDSVPNQDTPGMYHQHDLFINLTDTGSFDKSTLEAMACGIPVLVSNGAFRDIFPPELRSLLMFSEKDYDDLAAKIREFVALAPSEREAIGRTMRILIQEKHSLSGLMEKLSAALLQ